jgi:hypothetical protein
VIDVDVAMNRRLAVASALAWVAGCSLVTELDSLSSGDAPTPGSSQDGASDVTGPIGEDAPASSDARSGATDAAVDARVDGPRDAEAGPPPLLANGGFEGIGSVCSPWTPTHNGTTQQTPPGRTGGYACRVCTSPSETNTGIVTDGPKNPVGKYRIAGYLHAVSGSTGTLTLYTDYGNAGGYVGDFAASYPSNTAWSYFEATGTIPNGMTYATLFAKFASNAVGSCFEIDDVSFEYLGP